MIVSYDCPSFFVFYNPLLVVFRCICEAGYTGKNCENQYIPCDPSPCQNDGVCREIDSLTYECKCPTGGYIDTGYRTLILQTCKAVGVRV